MGDSPRIEELRRRVLVDPASIAFAALAEEYRRAGRYVEAVATCQAGLQRHPAYLSARVTLGRALLEMGQYEEARDQLDQVLRVAPENLAAIRGLAEIHHRRGELPEALEQYRSALHVSQHDPDLQQAVDTIARQVGPQAGSGTPVAPMAAADTPPGTSAAPPAGTASTGDLPDGCTDQPPAAVPRQQEMPAAVAALGTAAPFDIAAIFDNAALAPTPNPAPATPDPAVTRLEAFLAAIQRARPTRRDPNAVHD